MITGFIETFRWPFRDIRWAEKTWPMPLLAFVPVLDIVAFEGWRIRVIKQMARGAAPLPEFDFVEQLIEGIRLILCRLLYVFVPIIVMNLLGSGGFIGRILDIGLFLSGDGQALGEDFISDLLTNIGVIIAWYVLSAPAFHCGMIRYALNDDWRCLLNIPMNILWVLRYAGMFLLFYVYAVLAAIAIFLISGFLTITAVGVILVPIAVFCLYYTMSAHELGGLAHTIAERRERRAAAREA
ncbi:MAG: DUF4013 domain-containing protein [Pseudomonadota bacterium]